MQFYLIVSAVMLFAGIYGFITRRNLLAILISIELILNAVNINFAVFNHYLYPGAPSTSPSPLPTRCFPLPWPLPKRPSPSPSSSIFTGISAILR